MIDLTKARNAFKNYVKNYDYTNGKIKLKVLHIERVATIAREIAKELNLEKEDIELAELIGLLHDIGRFEQVKRYNTYVDKDSVNHAELGIEILFKEGLIRKFIEDDSYDNIIKETILNHNTGRLPKGLNKKIDLHSRILRDADKVDIYKVIITDKIENTYGCQDMSNDIIKDEIIDQFKIDRCLDYKITNNGAEKMIAHIAYIFDINYDFSLKIIKEKDYINIFTNKYTFNNNDTFNKIKECTKIANEYIEERLSKGKI